MINETNGTNPTVVMSWETSVLNSDFAPCVNRPAWKSSQKRHEDYEGIVPGPSSHDETKKQSTVQLHWKGIQWPFKQTSPTIDDGLPSNDCHHEFRTAHEGRQTSSETTIGSMNAIPGFAGMA